MDLKTLLNQRNMTIEKLSEKSGAPNWQLTMIRWRVISIAPNYMMRSVVNRHGICVKPIWE